MLLDAFKSELYRFSKNRSTLFWSVGFVPLVVLVGGLGAALVFTRHSQKLKDTTLSAADLAASADLGAPLLALASQVANIGTLAFLLIGAATLFAGDYRWETWRLISARNTRANLLGGKLLAMVALVLASVVGLMLAGALVLSAAALFEGAALKFSLTGAQWSQFGLMLLLGMARIVQVLLLALLAAIVTRSLMATLFVPIAVSIAQSLGEKFGIFLQLTPVDWQVIFFSPGLAVSHLKEAVHGGLPPALADQLTWQAMASLGLWIAVPVGLAFVLFQRQPMSKE